MDRADCATAAYRSDAKVQLAAWLSRSQSPVLRQILSLCHRPGVVSFALGAPATELLPTDVLAAIAERLLREQPDVLQLVPPSEALCDQVTALMASRGVTCTANELLLVHGAQQGLDLIARLLLDDQREVLVEEATFPGLLNTLAPFRPRIIAVPSHPEDGIEVDAVERLLARGVRPAFLYTIPDAHNPLGTRLPLDRRRRLVELARNRCMPIVEDDPYGFLQYDDVRLPPLRALDADWIFYTGSFSKLLGPALRTGWVVAPAPLQPMLSLLKDLTDTDTGAFAQHLVARYLADGHFPAHLARLRNSYRDRRDRMVRALDRHLPDGARFHIPPSGAFIWVRLPDGIDTAELLRGSVEKINVAFVPGAAFGAGPRTRSCLRLCFTNCAADAIEDGIARLGRLLRA